LVKTGFPAVPFFQFFHFDCLLIIDTHNGIFPRPKSNLFGVFHGMGAVFLVDAFLQRLGIVALAADVVENKVEASLVEGNGVG
jgi:hypothetical protein